MPRMTAKQCREALEKLGLSQEGFGLFLGASERTGQRYASGGPPDAVAMLLELMLKYGVKPEDLRRGKG